MVAQVSTQKLLAEIRSDNLHPRRGLLDAFRLGRRAHPVTAEFLHAKVDQRDGQIAFWIRELKTRKRELEGQRADPMAWTRHGLAIVTGFAVLAAALSVDYMIIHEFWSRILANEFGEVPKSLSSSVVFKSAQVLFATLAFHFMLQTLGDRGRNVFKWFLFILTFCMLLGIGLIIATDWLPAGSKLFGLAVNQATESGQDMLASVGLSGDTASAPAAATAAPVTNEQIDTTKTLVRLGSLSVIFIIVTGVGALCMEHGIRGFKGIFGALSYEGQAEGSRRFQFLNDELEAVRSTLAHLEEPHSRFGLLNKYLSDFVTSYHEGISRYASVFSFLMGWNWRKGESEQRLGELYGAVEQVRSNLSFHEMPSPETNDAPHMPDEGTPRLRVVPTGPVRDRLSIIPYLPSRRFIQSE